ncbi:MAG: YraN family protein [Oligoflexales bacterium]
MQEAFFPIGNVAEQLVAEYISRKGHQVLCQNYRNLGFEIDIVSLTKNTLVLIEVKFRNRAKKDLDLSTIISPRKKRCLKKGINGYISRHQPRFDTVRCDLALACFVTENNQMQKKPYNPRSGIRLYYYEDIGLES